MSTEIKAYYKRELARMYGVSWMTLRSWIKPFERELKQYTKDCKLIKPVDVEIIFSKLGEPF